VGNLVLRPVGQTNAAYVYVAARMFNMLCFRIFVSQDRTQHGVKKKLEDKQTRHVDSE